MSCAIQIDVEVCRQHDFLADVVISIIPLELSHTSARSAIEQQRLPVALLPQLAAIRVCQMFVVKRDGFDAIARSQDAACFRCFRLIGQIDDRINGAQILSDQRCAACYTIIAPGKVSICLNRDRCNRSCAIDQILESEVSEYGVVVNTLRSRCMRA